MREKMRQLLRAPQFKPFVVRFSEGGTIIVSAADDVASNENATHVAIYESECKVNSLWPWAAITDICVISAENSEQKARELACLLRHTPFSPFTIFVFGEAEEVIEHASGVLVTHEEVIVPQRKSALDVCAGVRQIPLWRIDRIEVMG